MDSSHCTSAIYSCWSFITVNSGRAFSETSIERHYIIPPAFTPSPFNNPVVSMRYLGNLGRGSVPVDSLPSSVSYWVGLVGLLLVGFPPVLVFDLRHPLGDRDKLCKDAIVKFSLLIPWILSSTSRLCVFKIAGTTELGPGEMT